MDESFLDKLLRWCRDQKLNLDPSAEPDDEGTIQYLCRLRPWKQKKGFEVMYQESASTFEAAAKAAVTRYRKGKDQELDWSVRPWHSLNRVGRSAGADEDPPF